MAEIFKILIEQLNSAILVLLTLLLVAFWLVYKVTQVATQWAEQRGRYRVLEDDVHAIRAEIVVMSERINFIIQKTPQATVQPSSPIHLTPTGEEIRRAMKTDKLMAEYGGRLGDIVKAKNPTHVYDLQNLCLRAAEFDLPEMMKENELNNAKTLALKYGIPISFVMDVVAVLLRDKLLQELNISGDETAKQE